MKNEEKAWLQELAMSASQIQLKDKTLHWSISTSKNTYFAESLIWQGKTSSICEGYFDKGDQRIEILVKIIKDWHDNPRAINEIKILKHLWSEENPNQIHLPVLYDQFRMKDKRIGIILKQFYGNNLETIRSHPLYVNGVSDYHAAWMLSRMLAVAGFAHTKGVIHGNIEPHHVLVRPYDHNVCLVDWSWALQNETEFKTVNEKFSAPEVKIGEAMTSSDLYSIGKCIVYLLNGNTEDDSMPENVDIRFQRFVKNLLITSPYQRARDAWATLQKLAELRVEIWGPEKFVVFDW